jgi:hypothetical protein
MQNFSSWRIIKSVGNTQSPAASTPLPSIPLYNNICLKKFFKMLY